MLTSLRAHPCHHAHRYLFTVGERNGWEKTADTYKSWRRVPAFRFDSWGAFCDAAPFGATWVAVEMGGVPLQDFEHPERAVYVLGAEDAGLPAAVVRACHHCVSLEGVRAASFNVSVAGTLVMYDRLTKSNAKRATASEAHGEGPVPREEQREGEAGASSADTSPRGDIDVSALLASVDFNRLGGNEQ